MFEKTGVREVGRAACRLARCVRNIGTLRVVSVTHFKILLADDVKDDVFGGGAEEEQRRCCTATRQPRAAAKLQRSKTAHTHVCVQDVQDVQDVCM